MSKILIQIGAAEGNDHVTEIIKNETFTKVILVEPNVKNFKLLQDNYKTYNNIIFENIAISVENTNITLFAEDKNISYHGSVNYEHLLRHGHHPSNIKEFTIPALTFTSLLEKHNLLNYEIEFLFIDTEGHDCDIILSTNFNEINVKNICFETVHSDGTNTSGEKLKKTIKYLNSCGYEVDQTKKVDWSLWMVKTNIKN
jgi:FkbM family methyltransferase